MIVTVLGANSVLGKAVVRYLVSSADNRNNLYIVTWCYDSIYQGCDSLNDDQKTCTFKHYTGFKNLQNAMLLSDIVINAHEYVDMSLVPNETLLQQHNVEFVHSLMFYIDCPLIHISSVYLQCSHTWPNVNESENAPEKYAKEWPFKKYCASKAEAENLISNARVDSYILRAVSVFGEEDDCSVLTDLIKASSYFGAVPRIGGKDGVIQLAYAENVAIRIWEAAKRLQSDVANRGYLDDVIVTESSMIDMRGSGDGLGESQKDLLDTTFLDESGYRSGLCSFQEASTANSTRILELLILADDTPKRTLYQNFSPLLTNEKLGLSTWSMPFIPLYYLYLAFVHLMFLLSQFVVLPQSIQQLPDPSYLYMNFHHWTYFDTNKSKWMLGYRAPVDYQVAINRSVGSYHRLSPEKLHYSWKPLLK